MFLMGWFAFSLPSRRSESAWFELVDGESGGRRVGGAATVLFVIILILSGIEHLRAWGS
jgi:hypothetical protein